MLQVCSIYEIGYNEPGQLQEGYHHHHRHLPSLPVTHPQSLSRQAPLDVMLSTKIRSYLSDFLSNKILNSSIGLSYNLSLSVDNRGGQMGGKLFLNSGRDVV